MKYTVDSDALATATSTALLQIEDVQLAAGNLSTTLVSLESSWSGQASIAFQSSLDEWRGAQVVVEDAIRSLSTALGLAAEHYGVAEQDVLTLFSAA
ncbi:MAG: WXG100 family type VII secretion target [Microbacteriaceae bacterium]|nr:WXG100 family type VII secretion target [Microbacteriaceae bacterium]